MDEWIIANCTMQTCNVFPCVHVLCGAGVGDSGGRLSAAEVGDVARRQETQHSPPPLPLLNRAFYNRYITFANFMHKESWTIIPIHE